MRRADSGLNGFEVFASCGSFIGRVRSLVGDNLRVDRGRGQRDLLISGDVIDNITDCITLMTVSKDNGGFNYARNREDRRAYAGSR